MKNILFSTLYPEYAGDFQEDVNTLHLVEEYLNSGKDEFDFEILAGSAHAGVAERMSKTLREYPLKSTVSLIPFVSRDEFDEVRAHEIAFCKKWLAEQWEKSDFDYLVFLDADVRVSLADIVKCIATIKDYQTFIRIPYVLRDSMNYPPEQFGAFIHTRELLTSIPYSHVIYQTRNQGGKILRQGAPDCHIQHHLLSNGAKKIRPSDIETRHYTEEGEYRRFLHDRASRHCILNHVPGFDPELSDMAMEPSSLTVLFSLCRKHGLKNALDLGTGSGNTALTLLHAGVMRIVSIDQDIRFTKLGSQLCPEIDFRTVDVSRSANEQGATYDLANLAKEKWDIVVVDGPAKDPWGAAISASNVDANSYFFHDAVRHRTQIDWFVRERERNGCRVERTDITTDRGVSVIKAVP